jgi:hypothetical protein
MNKNLPENFISDPEKIIRKAMPKPRSPDSQPTTSALGDSTARSLTPTFEVRQTSPYANTPHRPRTTFVLVRQSL